MIASLVAAATRLITGVRRLIHPPCEGEQFIYFANHGSHLDFVVIWASLPQECRDLLSPAAAEDYWGKSKIRRRVACDFFHAVLIPREGITKDNHPLERLAAALDSGRSVLLFPEGTRRDDGIIGNFRSGLYHLARRFPSLPLVPVYLENLSRILPKGTLLPVPLIAQAHFREPIFLMEHEIKEAFLQRARASLIPETNPIENPAEHGS